MASEYGWTDEQIGELPLARLRQITAAIQMRRYTLQREENSRYSWLARTLGGLVAAGYQVEKGQENKGLTYAATIAYDDIEAALLKDGPSQAAPKENGAGSFERFMMMTGDLARRGKML